MEKETKDNEMAVDRTLAAVAYKLYPGVNENGNKDPLAALEMMIYDLNQLKSKKPVKMFTRKRLIKFMELLLPGN